MLRLSIQTKGGDERRESFDKSEINVGRVTGNDLVLPSGNVSKHHARILFRDGRLIVTDLKSTSGTYVNGRKIVQATIVREGDKIYIGDFVLKCDAPAQPPDEDERETPMPPAVAPASIEVPDHGGPAERRPPGDLFRDREAVEVPSSITRVVVHARGALVTREVELPADLRDGVVEIMVSGITPLAHGGSVRAALTGSAREVAQIETALHHSAQAPVPGPSRSRVRNIEARVARLRDEAGRLSRRRDALASISIAPPIRTIDGRKVQRDGLDTRIGDAIRVGELVTATTARTDEALRAVRTRLADAERELEAARLEDAQASSREQMGYGHPTRAIIVRLRGDGPPGKLTLTYAVPAARFWPTYTLRLSDGGKRASWSFEAIVAQRSGEDWAGVPLSLSTGDLVFDARLPELTSLRISRQMPPKRRAFRPPPEGIEKMFSFYLEFAVAVRVERPVNRANPPSFARFENVGAAAPAAGRRAMAASVPAADAAEEDDGDRRTPPYAERLAGAPSAPMGAPAPARGYGGPAGGGAAARPSSSVELAKRAQDYGAAFEEEAEPELVPSGAWDDHDALVLAPADDVLARGRLVAVSDPASRWASERAIGEIERATAAGHTDPLRSRGVFDHRYDAEGVCDVPSDGRVHRVPVRTAECPSRIHYTTVPSEAAEVYREAVLANPFAGPLLAGPVDVYLDGTLLTTASMEHIDRGGTLRVGMGVDDRFKVARNVRASEESTGLIGGSLAVTHNVSIEVTAAVRDPVSVTVLERVPVTDDKAMKILVESERPAGATYDQSDRGAAIRGARRFELALEPGKKGVIEIVYRLTFSNKLDVVGGSRRG